MIDIEPQAFEVMAAPYRQRARERVVATLGDAARHGRIDVRHLNVGSDADFRPIAEQTFDHGMQLGVETTADMLFYAALTLHAPGETFGSPAGAWIRAALLADDRPIAERLDAVHALLPPAVAERLAIEPS